MRHYVRDLPHEYIARLPVKASFTVAKADFFAFCHFFQIGFACLLFVFRFNWLIVLIAFSLRAERCSVNETLMSFVMRFAQ